LDACPSTQHPTRNPQPVINQQKGETTSMAMGHVFRVWPQNRSVSNFWHCISNFWHCIIGQFLIFGIALTETSAVSGAFLGMKMPNLALHVHLIA
jgi:hypothetical protein